MAHYIILFEQDYLIIINYFFRCIGHLLRVRHDIERCSFVPDKVET